jgi:hypothetical protein
MGLLGDPADPKVRQKVLSQLEYGDVAEVWKKQALKEAQSKKIIDAIEKGDVSVMKRLSQFDDQAFHLDKMDDYRLSDKYEELGEEKQQLFLQVMEWRLQALVSLANPQIPQQQQLAEQMVQAMPETFAQHSEAIGGPPPPVDAGGNPIQPPMDQAPISNVSQLQRKQ